MAKGPGSVLLAVLPPQVSEGRENTELSLTALGHSGDVTSIRSPWVSPWGRSKCRGGGK